jgi:hypothetical protein
MTEAADQPADLAKSVAIMSEYHWMFLRHLYSLTRARLAGPGLDALARGLWRYGYARGEYVRDNPATIAGGRHPRSLVTNWDAAELAVAAFGQPRPWAAIADGSATVTLPAAPGADYFARYATPGALDLHWQQVLSGMAAGFGDDVTVRASSADAAPWAITWGHPEFTAGDDADLDGVFGATSRYIELGRRSTGLIAALQMYAAMELIAAFDATGEELVRQAAYAFGAERGGALRARHLEQDIPINLATMHLTLNNERDPLHALFSIRGEAYSSPGVNQFDCTYCPLADIWATEGSQGLRLGYLFDMELHRGLLESFHPGAVVRWDALKTRGDAVCRFNFTIPELVTPQEALLLTPVQATRPVGPLGAAPQPPAGQ